MSERHRVNHRRTSRWGITIPLPGMPLSAHRELLAQLPDLGYTDAWSAETAGTDAFTPLALAAGLAPSLRLGTAIAPVFTRGPGLLAQSAATLAELAPERFVLGIGSSAPAIVQNWNATPFERPYSRVRDTLAFLRRALAGEKVTESYETFEITKFALENPPPVPPRIMLAALRPGMLRLAAGQGDGAITNWLAARDVSTVRGVIGPDVELAARIFLCPTEDAATARAIGRRMISSYLTVSAYAKFQDWLGRAEILAPMHERWAAGDRRGANEVIPDEVVDELVLHGSTESCREQVQSYVDAGLDTPIVAVIPTGDEPGTLVRALSPSAGA